MPMVYINRKQLCLYQKQCLTIVHTQKAVFLPIVFTIKTIKDLLCFVALQKKLKFKKYR